MTRTRTELLALTAVELMESMLKLSTIVPAGFTIWKPALSLPVRLRVPAMARGDLEHSRTTSSRPPTTTATASTPSAGPGGHTFGT